MCIRDRLFIRVLSKMLDMEVELPAELMDNPYLCAWFMREFAYWLLQYVDCLLYTSAYATLCMLPEERLSFTERG